MCIKKQISEANYRQIIRHETKTNTCYTMQYILLGCYMLDTTEYSWASEEGEEKQRQVWIRSWSFQEDNFNLTVGKASQCATSISQTTQHARLTVSSHN
jgi:hypothetical protein